MKANWRYFKITAAALLAGFGLQLAVLAQGNAEEPANTPPPGKSDTKPAAPSTGKPPGGERFDFPGGTPDNFVLAVQRHFGVDWADIAFIPDEMRDVRIPPMRVETPSVRDVQVIEKLYNSMGQGNPQLGQWHIEGNIMKPWVVMLVPGKDSPGAQSRKAAFTTKAFSLKGLPGEEWKYVQDDIDRAQREAIEISRNPELMRGRVSLHRDTSILVAFGSESFVNLVDSIVAAHQFRPPVRVLPTR